MEHVGDANFAIDFGGGRQIDVDLREPGQLWAAAGPALTDVDLWPKNDGDVANLRVQVRRHGPSIEIRVDRGAEHNGWWPADAVPRLAVTIDASMKTATATASVGEGPGFQEVLLGRIRF